MFPMPTNTPLIYPFTINIWKKYGNIQYFFNDYVNSAWCPNKNTTIDMVDIQTLNMATETPPYP